MGEDKYDVLKVRTAIRNQVFKHVKFVKGEGRKVTISNKVLQYGKGHEKVDLTKTNGYEYHIFKLLQIT